MVSDVPTQTHFVEHDIDVGDAAPVKQRFYKSSLEKREQLEAQVKYMLKMNLQNTRILVGPHHVCQF